MPVVVASRTLVLPADQPWEDAQRPPRPSATEDQQCRRALCHFATGAGGELLRHEAVPAGRGLLVVCPAALHMCLLVAVWYFLDDSTLALTVKFLLPSNHDVL